ncbi:MAG: hypothetical protein H6719_13730 [Sandaracinaceae bacterium]|nr:hypothetical protein [Sandaracinaceae bacterium]
MSRVLYTSPRRSLTIAAAGAQEYMSELRDGRVLDPRPQMTGALAAIVMQGLQKQAQRPTAAWIADELSRL